MGERLKSFSPFKFKFMEVSTYILIGLLYTLVNIFIRKIDTDGDYLLVFVWMFIWPLAFTALIVDYLYNKIYKNKI